jgi:hypothetical protein
MAKIGVCVSLKARNALKRKNFDSSGALTSRQTAFGFTETGIGFRQKGLAFSAASVISARNKKWSDRRPDHLKGKNPLL